MNQGMSNATFYKWRAKYGGIDVPAERAGERKSAAEKDVRRGAPEGRDHLGGQGKKVVRPFARREMAQTAVVSRQVSITSWPVRLYDQRDCYRYRRPASGKDNQSSGSDHRMAQQASGFTL